MNWVRRRDISRSTREKGRAGNMAASDSRAGQGWDKDWEQDAQPRVGTGKGGFGCRPFRVSPSSHPLRISVSFNAQI
jgi:hypothetical protein